MDKETVRKNLEKKFGPPRRLGGKGTIRTVQRRRVTNNKNIKEKKFNAFLEKNRINNKLGEITTVHFIHDDDTITTMESPEVKTQMQSQLFSISGKKTKKTILEVLSSIYHKLDPITQIKYQDQYKKLQADSKANGDDLSEVVDDFEKVSLQDDDAEDGEAGAQKLEEKKEISADEKKEEISVEEKKEEISVEEKKEEKESSSEEKEEVEEEKTDSEEETESSYEEESDE